MANISDELIIRFIHNTCTDEELLVVKSWLDESEQNVNHLFELERIALESEGLRADHASRRRVFNAVQRGIVKSETERRRRYRRSLFIRVAAAAAMIAVVTVAAVYMMRPPEVRMIEVVATNENVTVFLPDSTEVVLHNDSRLRYPERFASTSREVELEGEGFFNVSHDSARPFRVAGEYLNVEVLGTKFTFISRDTTENSVSLLAGSVEVSTAPEKDGIVLVPGQKAMYNVGNGHLTVGETNAAVDAAWHDHIIPFENADIKEIVGILKRLYGEDIVISETVDRGTTYSGVTYYCSEIDSTLTRLSNTLPIRFRRTGNKILIYPR